MKTLVTLGKGWIIAFAFFASWSIITITGSAIRVSWGVGIGYLLTIGIGILFYKKMLKADKQYQKGTSHYRSPMVFTGAIAGIILSAILYWDVLEKLWA